MIGSHSSSTLTEFAFFAQWLLAYSSVQGAALCACIVEMILHLNLSFLDWILKVTFVVSWQFFLAIPSSNDNWIVTAAIKSLNKDTFQDDSVNC